MFHRVAIGALQSVGATVVDIGLTTTPTCQLAVEDHHVEDVINDGRSRCEVLQLIESRPALIVQGNDLAIDHGLGWHLRQSLHDGGVALGEVVVVA